MDIDSMLKVHTVIMCCWRYVLEGS